MSALLNVPLYLESNQFMWGGEEEDEEEKDQSHTLVRVLRGAFSFVIVSVSLGCLVL